jgi:hypothetical protein
MMVGRELFPQMMTIAFEGQSACCCLTHECNEAQPQRCCMDSLCNALRLCMLMPSRILRKITRAGRPQLQLTRHCQKSSLQNRLHS